MCVCIHAIYVTTCIHLCWVSVYMICVLNILQWNEYKKILNQMFIKSLVWTASIQTTVFLPPDALSFCRTHWAHLTAEIFGLPHKSQPVDNTINLNFYIRHVSRTIYIIQVTVNVQIVMIAWNWKYNYSLANPACQKEKDPLRYGFIWMRIGTVAKTLVLSISGLQYWALCCVLHFIQKG